MKRNKPTILPEEENFISDSKAAIMNKTTVLANSILYAVVSLVVVSLTWSYFAEIDQITPGTGKIIPASKVKVIQSFDGGIIDNIFVNEGDQVQPNQVLVKLDDTRHTADYLNAYDKYWALSAMVARLTSEMMVANQIDFPKILLEKKPELADRETKLFETRREAGQKEFVILEHQLELAKKEFDMYQKLVSNGVVSMIDYYRAQRRIDDIKEKILRLQASFRESVLTELNQKKSELASLTEQLASFRDKIALTTIRSPTLGIIKKIRITTVGGTVTPGMDIMEIVPLSDALVVEAHIHPNDIEFVHVGQPAKVRLAAYDYTVYGSLHGIVEYVSADTMDDSKSLPGDLNPESRNTLLYYIVKIRIDANSFVGKVNPIKIIPGMIANVQIVTGKKRILDYLLKPLIKAKEEALRER